MFKRTGNSIIFKKDSPNNVIKIIWLLACMEGRSLSYVEHSFMWTVTRADTKAFWCLCFSQCTREVLPICKTLAALWILSVSQIYPGEKKFFPKAVLTFLWPYQGYLLPLFGGRTWYVKSLMTSLKSSRRRRSIPVEAATRTPSVKI